MQESPLIDESHCGPRKFTVDRRAVVDTHQDFMFGVDRVETRRIVVGEVHVDHNPVELAPAVALHTTRNQVIRKRWNLGLDATGSSRSCRRGNSLCDSVRRDASTPGPKRPPTSRN